jgi:hypothetical protein
MRIPNGHAIALEMVRACLKYLDVQRKTDHALLNISVTGPKQGPGDMKVRARVCGRELITAVCTVDRELCGMCYITTEYAKEELGFWCSVVEDGVEVIPLQGSGSEAEFSLLSQDTDALHSLLHGAIAEWNIWHCQKGFAAMRKSWLVGEPIVCASVEALSEAITEVEVKMEDRGKSSVIHPLLVSRAKAKS